MFANSLVRLRLPVAAIVVLAGWTGLSVAQEKKPHQMKPKTIVAVARHTSDLTTFSKLLELSGLAETLKGEGPYTVFAPTDEAFKKLGKELDELQKPENKDRLQRILKNHVLVGQKAAADIEGMKSIETMAGVEIAITIKDGAVMVGSASVTKADLKAHNGLIHIVDTVLLAE